MFLGISDTPIPRGRRRSFPIYQYFTSELTNERRYPIFYAASDKYFAGELVRGNCSASSSIQLLAGSFAGRKINARKNFMFYSRTFFSVQFYTKCEDQNEFVQLYKHMFVHL